MNTVENTVETTNTVAAPFEPLAPVTTLPTPKLSAVEAAKLLEVVNTVRSGESVYFVTFTYDKVTKAKPRIEGTHYQPLPGTTCKLHTGTVVKAPTNKKGAVYLLVRDAARAPLPGEAPTPVEDDGAGWTCVKPEGLTSFRVLPGGKLPGPVGRILTAAVETAVKTLAGLLAK